ncbi:MAG: nucleotidyltransferase family protein [Bacteroidales bacterium]|nr:nucleotidyltransferase family protein [Bacteroidales bacterium]
MTLQQVAYSMVHAATSGEGDRLPIGVGGGADEWWSLFRLLQENRVAAVCAEVAQAAGAPREVLMPWLAECEKAIGWQRHQREVQEEIADAMAKRGIATLVLKGLHTASHYPRPEVREFGDLDLYFYDKHDEADRVAREVLGVEIDNRGHHHSKYDYRGVTVESHFDFVNVYYPPSNRGYEAMLKALAPSATFEVLFLLRHMAGHFAAGRITLRDLADWTLTARALNREVDWELVRRGAREYGMEPFAAALEEVSVRQLQGVRMLGMSADKELADRVERDIVGGSEESLDCGSKGIKRVGWKWRRWNANRWKRKIVYGEGEARLLWSSFASHAMKPRSIVHKM